MNDNYILRFNELTQYIEFKHRSLKHIYHSVRALLDMYVTNCHSCSLSTRRVWCQSKSPSRERNAILCACRDGLPNGPTGPRPKGPWAQGGPKPESLREVAVINFACCQLFLDFIFVNIRGGLNVSLICGWKRCILLHVLTHGFIIRPCVRVHNNNTYTTTWNMKSLQAIYICWPK